MKRAATRCPLQTTSRFDIELDTEPAHDFPGRTSDRAVPVGTALSGRHPDGTGERIPALGSHLGSTEIEAFVWPGINDRRKWGRVLREEPLASLVAEPSALAARFRQPHGSTGW